MFTCQLCKVEKAVHVWQPFGPDTDARKALKRPGWHDRGFPAIKVCERCAGWIREGDLAFKWRDEFWMLAGAEVRPPTPDEMADILALEEE